MGIQVLFKTILEAEGKFCNLKKQGKKPGFKAYARYPSDDLRIQIKSKISRGRDTMAPP
jgi:hypothetical protein